MATIDLIVLGMLKQEPMGAYEIQKQVEYKKISKWVKVSTPSIYKKVLQLEQKGYITGRSEKAGKMPAKAVYSLTAAGEKEFERLMLQIAEKPVNIFLDFNAVVVNLQSLAPSKQKQCLSAIAENVWEMKSEISSNLKEKDNLPNIPDTGMAVLHQQLLLADAIEKWIKSLQDLQATD